MRYAHLRLYQYSTRLEVVLCLLKDKAHLSWPSRPDLVSTPSISIPISPSTPQSKRVRSQLPLPALFPHLLKRDSCLNRKRKGLENEYTET